MTKKELKEKGLVSFGCTVNKELMAKIETEAKKEMRTIAAYVRKILTERFNDDTFCE
jgi:hypothetical protein